MAETTHISWCDHTWSPWYGCTQVSLGEHGACVGCYARQLSEIRQGRVVFGGPGRGEGTRSVKAESGWKEPLRWERAAAAANRAWFAPEGAPDGDIGKPWPHSPFVFPSMCDPFDNHPDLREPRRRFFDLIRATPHLTWLLLTKRPGNIVKLFADTLPATADKRDAALREAWPRNAAIGCTVVTQEEADRDIPHLLAAKAALKPAFAFLSMEPLLGPVDLTRIDDGSAHREVPREEWGSVDNEERPPGLWWNALTGERTIMHGGATGDWSRRDASVDWVITGGETDQGSHKARPSHPDWFRTIRDQCASAGVPYHHKQHGEWSGAGSHLPTDLNPREVRREDEGRPLFRVGKKAAGRLLDGVLHDARPEVR